MNINNSLLKLPGLCDVHVHLREPGATQKEDFVTGTHAAIAGGYTQVLDMPNNFPPTITSQALEDKIKKAKGRIWCDLGFNFGATTDSIKYFPQIPKKAFGLKVYMDQTTGTLLIDKFKDRDLIFKSWKSKLPIMVHAEGETVQVAIKLAQKYKKALHVCHITDDQIDWIKQAKSRGVNITCEVCPHHLFLTRENVKQLGPLGVMKPPLPTEAGQKKFWSNLEHIDMISTDHAPHTLEEKYDKDSPKFGVPGLETTLPLMLEAADRGKISMGRLVEMTSTNPGKIFHLPIQSNTFITVDSNVRYKISDKGLFTKCGWTPFVGLDGRGKVKKVVLHGQTVFENGKFIGKPQGKVIYPN